MQYNILATRAGRCQELVNEKTPSTPKSKFIVSFNKCPIPAFLFGLRLSPVSRVAAGTSTMEAGNDADMRREVKREGESCV